MSTRALDYLAADVADALATDADALRIPMQNLVGTIAAALGMEADSVLAAVGRYMDSEADILDAEMADFEAAFGADLDWDEADPDGAAADALVAPDIADVMAALGDRLDLFSTDDVAAVLQGA